MSRETEQGNRTIRPTTRCPRPGIAQEPEAAGMSLDRTKLLEAHASAGVGVADTTQAQSVGP